MMYIFKSKYFNIILPVIFVLFLLLLLIYGCLIGVRDVESLVVNAILMFLATLIAISLPLYANSENEQKRREEELKMIYVSVSRYVGGEILDNIIEIQDILTNNKKTIKQMESHNPGIPDREKKIIIATIWKSASETLIESLQDKHHNNMVMSGLVSKIPDDSVATGIRDTYQKMDNLKKRLQSMAKFLELLLSPNGAISSTFLDYQFNTKLQEAITATKLDIKIFNKAAEDTKIEINKFLKPYGKEIKIINYKKTKKASRKRIR